MIEQMDFGRQTLDFDKLGERYCLHLVDYFDDDSMYTLIESFEEGEAIEGLENLKRDFIKAIDYFIEEVKNVRL